MGRVTGDSFGLFRLTLLTNTYLSKPGRRDDCHNPRFPFGHVVGFVRFETLLDVHKLTYTGPQEIFYVMILIQNSGETS